MSSKLLVVYRIRSNAQSIEDRARTIAVEQSVEMPVAAIDDATVLHTVVGRVESIVECGDHLFDATLALEVETTGFEAGQLMNMLFGNTSIHDDVVLQDVQLPPSLTERFGGPRHGADGLKARVRGQGRALTCSALKPLGLSPAALADVAGQLARGGLDYIKDDHGLADQRYAPFAPRVAAVAKAVEAATRLTGKPTRYLPNISGNLDAMRAQVRVARDCGLDTVLIAPMVSGLPSFQTIVGENRDIAFIAHPALAGAARISPPALYGTLFRLLGADGVIYPNVGGRFGYSDSMCRAIADAALAPREGLKPSLPVPAGGMKRERVPEILSFYGNQAMLLIGGDLLAARGQMTHEAALFQHAVETFAYESPVSPSQSLVS